MTAKTAIILLLLGFAVHTLYKNLGADTWTSPTPPQGPTLRSSFHPSAPRQETVSGLQWAHGPYTLRALAAYSVTATVAEIARYRHDEGASLAPYDFVLAWAKCDDPDILQDINVSQSQRFFFWRTEKPLRVPQQEIGQSMANTHLIPKNDEVLDKLDRVKIDARIQINGYLVEATRPDGWHWSSSLTRSDSGAGACELLWVDDVVFIPINNP